jgi:hypothetical protein
VSGRLRRVVRGFAQTAAVVLITAALAEATLAAIRHLAFLYRFSPLLPLARQLYFVDRATVQLLGNCARWDPTLGYTLKPGACTFANTEYRTTLRVNSLGVRDSEQALSGPEIVVLGDSFAMGWGVEGDETFAAVVGRESGARVLNTGIPSYGTVRELMMLGRVDRTRTRTILWQFCNNDYIENQAYVKNGNRLPTLSRAEWEGWVTAHARERRYVPFRYLFRAVGSRLEALFSKRGSDPSNPDPDDPAIRKQQVACFLDVLETSPVDLSPYRIVLFELNGRNLSADWFLRMLADELRAGAHSEVAKRLVLVDVAARLDAADFYLLDDHLTPAGHRKVAGILLPYVEPAAGETAR